MSNIAFYDPDAVVANQVIRYLVTVNTPDYDSESNKIVNPDLSALSSVPMKWWKVSAGVIVEMNQTEKDLVDNQILPNVKQQQIEFINNQVASLFVSQGYSLEVHRSSFETMYSDSQRYRPNRMMYIQKFMDWSQQIDSDASHRTALINDATSIDQVRSIQLDTTALISADPHITVDGALSTSDGTYLEDFLNANARVIDPYTNVDGPYYLMEILNLRREVFNDSTNPLYVPGLVPIVGTAGYLQDHADRIGTIETIHQKLGWHEQEVTKANYYRPIDVLVYYGWLNSFNSAVNAWTNEKVAQDMAKYGIIVLGDGIQDPTHGDYANTQIIIPRIKALNPAALIFGYVATPQLLATFQTKVDQWNTLQVQGIFMDEAGYDYGNTRSGFNTRVEYIHGKTNSNKCFANAWNTDHILGTANDPSYPNASYNPSLTESALNIYDWVMLESFPINTDAFAEGYESAPDWAARGVKALTLRYTYGVNFAGVGIINNGNADGSRLFNFGMTSAMALSLEAYGTSDTNYAAGSAAVKYWGRPSLSNMTSAWSLTPAVQVDLLDSSVYRRYLGNSQITLGFQAGSQFSSIVIQGTTGIVGITGAHGLTGVQGITGLQGTTGLRGITGLQGTTGFQGVTGLVGQTGLQGQTGIGYAPMNAESDSSSSTTSTTHTQKLRLTTPSLSDGTYRIGYYAELRSSSTSYAYLGRLQIDGKNDIADWTGTPRNINDWDTHSGFGYRRLTDGTHNIDIQYAIVNAAAAAYIRRSRLEVWRTN